MDTTHHYHNLRELSGREQEIRDATEQRRRFEEYRAAHTALARPRRTTVARRVIAVLIRIARTAAPVRRPSA